MTQKSAYQTGGAAVGAGIGTAVGGPAGTVIGGGLGTLAGGLLYDLFNGDPVQDAEKAKQAEMAKAAQAYAAYRPQLQAAHQQGLLQQLQTMGGANNALRLMYGEKYDPRVFAPDIGRMPNPDAAGTVGSQLSMIGRR
jgi:hypothetical protein